MREVFFVGKFGSREALFVGKSGLQQFTFASPLVIAMMLVGDDYDDAITIMMIGHYHDNEHGDDTAYDDDSDDTNGD